MKLSNYYQEVNSIITSVPVNTVGIYCHLGIIEASMGIAGETGEVVSACLKRTNIEEEIGDCMYYITKMAYLLCGNPDILIPNEDDVAIFEKDKLEVDNIKVESLFIYAHRISSKIVDYVKKIYFKEQNDVTNELMNELESLLLTIKIISIKYDISINSALEKNIIKLKERYNK